MEWPCRWHAEMRVSLLICIVDFLWVLLLLTTSHLSYLLCFQPRFLLPGQLKWDFFEGGSKCEGEALGQVLYTEECALGEPELSSDDDDDAAITDDRHVFNPPPSVSTTPFPTSAPVNVTMSNRYYCAAASKKVTLKASQVRAAAMVDATSACILSDVTHNMLLSFSCCRPSTAFPSTPTTKTPTCTI